MPSALRHSTETNQLSKISRGRSSESSVFTFSQISVGSVTCGIEIVRNVDGYSHHLEDRIVRVISNLESDELGHNKNWVTNLSGSTCERVFQVVVNKEFRVKSVAVCSNLEDKMKTGSVRCVKK